MTQYVTCRLTAKNRDQLLNPTFGNRVWATFTFLFYCPVVVCQLLGLRHCVVQVWTVRCCSAAVSATLCPAVNSSRRSTSPHSRPRRPLPRTRHNANLHHTTWAPLAVCGTRRGQRGGQLTARTCTSSTCRSTPPRQYHYAPP